MSSTLRKGLEILLAISEEGTENGLSISRLTGLTGFPPSTVHRLLQTFREYEVVEQVPETKNYRLGPKLLKMGLQVRGMLDLRRAALPVMRELTARTGEDSYLTVAQGKMGIFLERVEGPHPVKVIELVGKEMPLHTGAARKALLSFMDGRFLRSYLADLALKQGPGSFDPEKLREEIRKIRKQGYAVSYGDYLEYGVGVAAPVRDFSGAVRASVGVIGLKSRLNGERLPFLIKAVKQAAADLSRRMGYSPV
ncbi:MAG: IclR family transcriptional regulator [Desulfotomaculales bacterium]